MKDKIEKLKRKQRIIEAKTKLLGQKENLRNRQRQLDNLRTKDLGINIRPFSLGGFVQRGNEVTENIFGFKKVRRK